MMRTKSVLQVCLWACALALLAGCPETGVKCSAGTTRCAEACFDLTSDTQNCGACGVACGAGQLCGDSVCQCKEGSTRCSGACVQLGYDPQHCGACGNAIAPDQVCEPGPDGGPGTAKPACTLGTSTQCGQSCVNLTNDTNHCGACNAACSGAQSCHAGTCTYDLVAACPETGDVVGFQASSLFKGPVSHLGSRINLLSSLQDVLLAVDDGDRLLRQAKLGNFAALPSTNPVGFIVNDLVTQDPFIYVVNAGSGTLQVLRRSDAGVVYPPDAGPDAGHDAGTDAGSFVDAGLDGGVDGGTPDGGGADGGQPDAGADAGFDAGEDAGAADAGDGGPPPPLFPDGFAFATVAEVPFGANTFPQAVARLGNDLYVPLYGDFLGGRPDAGGFVVRVNVANPAQPQVVQSYNLNALNLQPFALSDGGREVSYPAPFSITAHNGKLYAPLGNLVLKRCGSFPCVRSGGPGMVARIDPSNGQVTVIPLDGARCLNAGDIVSANGRLFLTCKGDVDYSQFPAPVTGAGAVMLDEQDVPVAYYPVACPTDADGGVGACTPPGVTRLAVRGSRIFLGEAGNGSVYVLDQTGNAFTQRRGFLDGGSPLLVCPAGPFGYSEVADLYAVP